MSIYEIVSIIIAIIGLIVSIKTRKDFSIFKKNTIKQKIDGDNNVTVAGNFK